MTPAIHNPTPGVSGTQVLGSLLGVKWTRGKRVNAWLATKSTAADWDGYLRGSGQGQFQQSSIWAEVKQSDGWHAVRVVLEQEGITIGGFQLLWRHTRFGRMGFLNKGPVLS